MHPLIEVIEDLEDSLKTNMKKFKLLVNLGTSKKNDVLEEEATGFLTYTHIRSGLDIRKLLEPHEILLMIRAGMLEEVTEKDEYNWKPENDDYYWYFTSGSELDKTTFITINKTDINRYYFGNCFSSEALALEARDKIKLLLSNCRKV